MRWFIKTEVFTEKTLNLSPNYRNQYIKKHREWVENLRSLGIKISSGYLVDSTQCPGGGGLILLQAESFQAAKDIISKDPMITNNLVNWKLKEWIPVAGELY